VRERVDEHVAPRAPAAAPALRAQPAALALQRAIGNRAAARMLSRVTFHPTVAHHHAPSGKWSEVQKAPDSGWKENLVCRAGEPWHVVAAALLAEFGDKPLAKHHLEWYLSKGKGADYDENANLERMLRTDAGVQRAIAAALPGGARTGTVAFNLKIEQGHYSNQDFRFAFGAIDHLDVEVDFAAGTLHAWFRDCYEWHPYYPALYTAFPDDGSRQSNCVHAALVELKSSGAADFWMQGEATVPLSVLPLGTGAAGGGGSDL